MNYKESIQLQELINSSQKILLNCHRNPDADSLGGAIALSTFLKSLGKEVLILTPSAIPDHLKYLVGDESIQKVEFDTFDFASFDLLILSDTASWGRVFSSTQPTLPTVPVVVIDNHETNTGFGAINILDYKISSACEMIYRLFQDWEYEITQPVAHALLSGIVGDTGSFQFEVYDSTLEIAQTLIKAGAKLDEINFHLFNSIPLELINFWGVVIRGLKVEDGIAYSAIPFSLYEQFSHLSGTRETSSTMIIRKIADTRYGFVVTEDHPGTFSASFRSREAVDVAKIAAKMGGGGHPGAAGVTFAAENIQDAVKKILAAGSEVTQN